MSRPRAGYIGHNRVPGASAFNSAASGAWTVREAEAMRRAGTWPIARVDPFSANVSLMLHFNGTNGSTTFTDTSPNNFTVTRSGNAAISTAQSQFGGSSVVFDGDSDYLSAGSNSAFAFGTGDFTIELWYRSTEASESDAYFFFCDDTGGLGFGLETVAGQKRLVIGRRGITVDHSVSHTPPQNTWQHYAVTRQGTTIKLFIGGSQVLSETNTQNYTVTGPCIIGGIAALPEFSLNGYMDELRVTKGVARTITLPTAAYED